MESTALAPVLVAEPQSVQVGNRVVHDTHLLERHRGVSWCWRCGARAQGRQLKFLAAPCRRAPLKQGKDMLARLRRGWPPVPGKQWPIQPNRNGVVVENLVQDDVDMSTPTPPSVLGAERVVYDTHP